MAHTHPAMSVPCPQCGAGAGDPCRNYKGHAMAPHTDRRKAGQAAEEARIQAAEAEAAAAVRGVSRSDGKRRQLQQWAGQHKERTARFWPSAFVGTGAPLSLRCPLSPPAATVPDGWVKCADFDNCGEYVPPRQPEGRCPECAAIEKRQREKEQHDRQFAARRRFSPDQLDRRPLGLEAVCAVCHAASGQACKTHAGKALTPPIRHANRGWSRTDRKEQNP